jgi:hypothetical protein
MAKSPKNQVRDILRAQGIYDEPKDEAVMVLGRLLLASYKEGGDDERYNASF